MSHADKCHSSSSLCACKGKLSLNLCVFYADLTVGGTTVTLRPVLDTPLLSPTATLALGAFQVTKVSNTANLAPSCRNVEQTTHAAPVSHQLL